MIHQILEDLPEKERLRNNDDSHNNTLHVITSINDFMIFSHTDLFIFMNIHDEYDFIILKLILKQYFNTYINNY